MSDEDDEDEPLTELARGFRKRTLATARLAAKLGIRYAKHTIGASQAVDERAKRAAEELAREMGRMKGLVMKLGQIASYMPGATTPEAQAILAKLQAKSTAMAPEQVARVVREELGGEPDALFESWDPKPAASASIGQVHRARVEGRDVAVKVQYPDIEALVRSDLDTIGMLTRISTFGTSIDGAEIAAELRARLLEECDYGLEAQWQRLFAGLLGEREGAHVPEVIGSRSARRVLTSAWAPGVDIRAFAANASQAERDRAGMTIFATCFDTLLGHCVYNGDPHPGNYLFEPSGSVTFLDFGCVRSYPEAMIDTWKKKIMLGMLDERPSDVREGLIAVGLAPARGRFDWDHQMRVMEYLYRPFKAKTPFLYTDAYVRESYDLLVLRSPNQRASGMPREWLLLNRLQWGMNAVLAQLGARGLWGEAFRRAAESPTRPARPPSR